MGSSRHMSIGPFALVRSSSPTRRATSSTPTRTGWRRIDAVMCLSMMVGTFLLLMATLRLGARRRALSAAQFAAQFSLTAIVSAGAIASFLSDSVLQGFTSAAAVLISTSQLKHLLGMKIPRAHFMETLYYAVTHIGEANPATVGVGVGGVALLLGVKRINKAKCPNIPLPEQLLLLLVATVATYAFSLDAPPFSLPILGDVPSGLPAPRFPPVGQPGLVFSLLKPTLVVGTFCFILSVSLARTFAMKFEYKIDPNQSRRVGPRQRLRRVLRGVPASGSLSRSALVASSCGAECTPMHGVFVLLVMLTLLLLARLQADAQRCAHVDLFAAVKSLFDVRRVRTPGASSAPTPSCGSPPSSSRSSSGFSSASGSPLSPRRDRREIVAANHALLGQLLSTRLYRDVAASQARLVPGVAVFRFDASRCEQTSSATMSSARSSVDPAAATARRRLCRRRRTPDGGSTPSVSATPEPTRWRPAKDAPLAPAAPSDEPPPWVRPSTVGREDDAAPAGENGNGDGLSALRDAIAPTPELSSAPPDEAPAARDAALNCRVVARGPAEPRTAEPRRRPGPRAAPPD